MKKGNLSRNQAIQLAGIEAVKAVEAASCEPTNRVGYNGACQGDHLTEWAASVAVVDDTLTAYYYTSNEDDKTMSDNDCDGSYIDWQIAGYELQ